MKKLFLCLWAFLALGIFNTAQAYDYTITDYNVYMDVKENNSINITEDIGTYFLVPKHGIYRTLPLKYDITGLDGVTRKIKAGIINFRSDHNINGYAFKGDMKSYILGDPKTTITGPEKYTLTYTYKIGDDKVKDYDELYFNIIGTQWDAPISNVYFNIQMPKTFDASKLHLTSGANGSTDSSKIVYKVKNNNQILGRYLGTLNPGEGITIRLILPQGYFKTAGLQFDATTLACIFVPIIFLLITYLLWYFFGKDNNLVDTVEFYPPENLNSAEVGFVMKGQSNSQDIMTLLVYLAGKGYIKIVENEEKHGLFDYDSVKFIKLKDYDGDNEIERIFLRDLFLAKETTIPDDLKYSFYKTINKIRAHITKPENRNAIYEKSSLNKTLPVYIMAIIAYILITVKPVAETTDPIASIFAVVFTSIGFAAIWTGINLKGCVKIIPIVWGSLFAGFPWLGLVMPGVFASTENAIAYFTGFACIIAIIQINSYMPKRTHQGNILYGRILGFKNFLIRAEKEKLEKLVLEDPEYFYNILPFTYVLGVSEKWINKFEGITLKEPEWYQGRRGFTPAAFGTAMTSMLSSTSSVAASMPSSSGSGGGGRGGCSGGGGGGGGGGSW